MLLMKIMGHGEASLKEHKNQDKFPKEGGGETTKISNFNLGMLLGGSG